MAEDNSDCECPCTNIAIMQLFHELKQKFPYVPDRVVNECIRKNGHDKGACEWALERENRAYLLHSYPPGLGSRMSSEENFGPSIDSDDCCRRTGHPHSHLPAGSGLISRHPETDVSDFDRRLPGRQSLDSLCRRHHVRKSVTFKHYSDESLHHPSTTTENFSRSNEEESCETRLPYVSCNYNNDDLNLTVLNSRGPVDIGEIIGHRCQEASFIRGETTRSTVPFRDRERPANRPSSLVNDTGVGGAGDLRLEIASDVKSCHCERTSVSVVSSCSVERGLPKGPHSAPVTPSGYQQPLFPPLSLDVTTPRHRTALSVEPSPPYIAHIESPSQRPFTSVNLTLRPPSSDPQPPIDIRSSAGGGLTYSTCSYDPRQGYQSRLRISIGPGGQGSVSAARTKTTSVVTDGPYPSLTAAVASSPSLPTAALVTDAGVIVEPSSSSRLSFSDQLDPVTQATVNEQLSRKQRLEKELAKEKERLRIMQEDVATMERDLNSRRSKISKRSRVQELKEEISKLVNELDKMTLEVDHRSLQIQVPLGETSEDFYRNIYRGQEGHLRLQPTISRASRIDDRREDVAVVGPSRRLPQHHRMSVPTIAAASSVAAPPAAAAAAGPSVTMTSSDGPNWTCHLCTFRNHPLLDSCEQCDMPRSVFGKPNHQAGRKTI